eukprot:412386-Prymnesium_polylepis.1
MRAGRLRAASLRVVPPPPRFARVTRSLHHWRARLRAPRRRLPPLVALCRWPPGSHPAAPRLQCALWCALQLPR